MYFPVNLKPATLLACAAIAGAAQAAPQFSITPPTGSGRAGEVLRIAGSGLAPSTSVFIEIGGVEAGPGDLLTDATGALPPTLVLLAGALPAGRHDARIMAGAPAVFRAAYLVRPVVTLDPPIGDGRAGATWRTNKAVPLGGFVGMVFTLAGTGFPKGAFIAADSIHLGRAATVHDPVRIGADGVLPSVTLVVASDLAPGRYDLVLPPAGGAAATFPSAYNVAPWAATDTVRQHGAGRVLEAARKELKDLVKIGADVLPPEEVKDVTTDLAGAEGELKAGNFDNAEDLSRQVRDKLVVLGRQVEETRKEKLRSFADVIGSGFDTIQPPGAPPNRQAGATVDKGRRRLAEAQAAITAAKFEDARTLMKAANELLKKARAEAGVQATEEPIRW